LSYKISYKISVIVRLANTHPPYLRKVGEGTQYDKNSNTIIFLPETLKPRPHHTTCTTTTKMPLTSAQIEARVIAASTAMDADPFLKASVAARQFSAPYQRLLRRRAGVPPSSSRGGHNKKLDSIQDKALRDYIYLLYSCGTPPNKEAVCLAANRLLYYSTGDIKKTASIRWTKAWIKRNSEYLKTLKSKPMSAQRLNSHKIEDIQEHFRNFQKCKDYWGIQDEDIYNFDETGFQIGVLSGEQVIVPADCIAVYTADPENKELITSVETINYGGRKVPPMIIFAGAYHLRRYFKNDLDGDILFTRSSSGYSNDKLGIKYLKHFDQYTRNSVGKYRMLLFDGHGSHLTQEFIDFCWDNHIRPFLLPSHTTHLLQPLDVGVFQTLKHNFKKEVRKQVFLGAQEVSRVDFFAFFQSFHDKTFKNPRIHKSAFRKTGLIPYNPLLVLEKMQEYRALTRPQTPPPRESSPIIPSSPAFQTPPLPQTSEWAQFQTPLTLRSRKYAVDYIKSRQIESVEQGIPLSPTVLRVSEKVEKAAQSSMLSGALSKHRLQDLANAEAARKKLKEGSGKIVQKYGEIRVHHARLQIQAEEEDEREVINMRLKRKEKVWKKNFLAVMKELRERS
jgi:DDE superfamily endonuclease/Tc5 transposase DNA-binding domain